MKEIYLHCSDFEKFGWDSDTCCFQSGCHEDHQTPPQKGKGSNPIVSVAICCSFDTNLLTRDNCAKLASNHRTRQTVWRKKRRLEEQLAKSAVRLADARLNTYGRSGPGELKLEDAREEVEAVEQYRAAITASRVAWQKKPV